jgi:hypothetical protein
MGGTLKRDAACVNVADLFWVSVPSLTRRPCPQDLSQGMTPDLIRGSEVAGYQTIAVDPAGHQAVLDHAFGVQFAHQKQAEDEQQQRDRHAAEAGRLSIGGFLVFVGNPVAFLMHPDCILRPVGGVIASHGCGDPITQDKRKQ